MYNSTLFEGIYANFYQYELNDTEGQWICPDTDMFEISENMDFNIKVMPCEDALKYDAKQNWTNYAANTTCKENSQIEDPDAYDELID